MTLNAAERPASDAPLTRNDLEWLLAFGRKHRDIMKITIEQLHAFALVAVCGSVSEAASKAQKQQSSIQKSVDTLNLKVTPYFKQNIIQRGPIRGRALITQPAGSQLAELSGDLLRHTADWLSRVTSEREDNLIVVGITTFLLPILAAMEPFMAKKAAQRRVAVHRILRHLRTGKVQEAVLNKEVDCALGGLTTSLESITGVAEGLEFLEYDTDEYGILTNYDMNRTDITFSSLLSERTPVLLPTSGVIYDLIATKLQCFDRSEIAAQVHVTDWCDDVHFALEILSRRVYDTCMFGTRSIYARYKDLPGFQHVRFLELKDLGLVLRYGLFRRANERDLFHRDHPLSIFWDAYQELAPKKPPAVDNVK